MSGAHDLPNKVKPNDGMAAAIVGITQNIALTNGSAGPALNATSSSSNEATLGVPDLSGLGTEEQYGILTSQLQVEQRIAAGAENLLGVSKSEKKGEEFTKKVESELRAARLKVNNIESKLTELREMLPGPSNHPRAPARSSSSSTDNVPELHTGNPASRSRAAATAFARRAEARLQAAANGRLTPAPSSAIPFPHSESTTTASRLNQTSSADQEGIQTALAQAKLILSRISTILESSSLEDASLSASSTPLTPNPNSSSTSSLPGSKRGGETPKNRRQRLLIEALNELVSTFSRNRRVPYEIDLSDVGQSRHLSRIRELVLIHVSISILSCLAENSSKETRGAAYRVLRHLIVDVNSVYRLRTMGLDWYIIRHVNVSLSRDVKHGVEKEQTLKLIARLIDMERHRSTYTSSSASSSTSPVSNGQVSDSARTILLTSGSELTPASSRARGTSSITQSLGYEQPNSTRGSVSLQRLSTGNCSALGLQGLNADSAPLATPTSSLLISDSVVRALVAVAEYPDDPLRLGCLVLLVDLLLVNTELVHRNSGMRVLLATLTEGPADISQEVAMALLQILDMPASRRFLEGGRDLEIAFAGFTDSYRISLPKGSTGVDRMRIASRVIVIMFRTWSGLMYLCTEDMKALKSFIGTMNIQSLDTRTIVLDTFFEVLKIKTPEWYDTFLDGRRLTLYQKRGSVHPSEGNPPPLKGKGKARVSTPRRQPSATLKITDQFLALLLVILTDSGLIDALVDVLKDEDCDPNIWRKATLLLGEILYMSNRLLPLTIAAGLQSLPRLFELAVKDKQTIAHDHACTALSSFESFERTRVRSAAPSDEVKRLRANSVEDSVRRNQRQNDQARIQLGMQIDDKTFQTMLVDTQVMTQPNHAKWNFEILIELVEGPLLNSRRLEEAMKGSRFGRKLMSFLHPRSKRFSIVPKTEENMRWVRLACSLITTLITSPDGHGIRFLLNDDVLLHQLTSCFAELGPFQGATALDPVFSRDRVQNTLTSGYFEIIGILSKHPEGVDLMEKTKLFTAFYHITELRSRDDLIESIIKNLDYTIDGHSRIVLSKALTSSTKRIRLNSTEHLGQLVRSSAAANDWTLRLLLTQLYDADEDVSTLAMTYLEAVCEDPVVLELVVALQPTLDHLGELGHRLLLKFMSTSTGFEFLRQSDYIDREIDRWFHEQNAIYVTQVETYLASALGQSDLLEKTHSLAFEGLVPPHFYGEMAKSVLGSQVLWDKGHFNDFSDFIRQHGMEEDDVEIIGRLKSMLWAVGHIGAAKDGLSFLEEEGVVPVIVDIAERSPVLSIRGTCFYVLGLISSTDQGADLLMDFGWEATLTPLQTSTGLCLPRDFASFVKIPSWGTPSMTNVVDQPTQRLLAGPVIQKARGGISRRLAARASLPEHERAILDNISALSNTVIASEAARALSRMKSRHTGSFQSITLFAHVLRILATERYKLPTRRFILEQLFGIGGSPSSSLGASAVVSLTKDNVGDPAVAVGIPMTAENMRAVQAEFCRLEVAEREFEETIQARAAAATAAASAASAVTASISEAGKRDLAGPSPSPKPEDEGTFAAHGQGKGTKRYSTVPITAGTAVGRKDSGKRATMGGSVLNKYAPVRKPQAPIGVPRVEGFPDVDDDDLKSRVASFQTAQ